MTEPLVTIDQGQLRGRTCTDANGGVYYSFQGIPYAKPPTGKLRFKVNVYFISACITNRQIERRCVLNL